MDNQNEHIDDTADQVMQAGQKVGGKAGKKAGKAVGKAAKKAAKKVAKMAIKVAGKVAMAAVQAIGAFLAVFWPVVLVIAVLIIVIYAITDLTTESRPKNQELQAEELVEQNEYEEELDDQGYYPIKELSEGNKLVKAFYTYFSEKSYYVMIEGEDEPHQANSDWVIDKEIKDEYNREELFYLNPNVLFTLDEYLNQGEVRTPEQFIQPVPYDYDEDKDTITLTDISDKEGNLSIKSTEYGKDGKQTGEDTIGAWDYGFAPVLHYKDYEIEAEERGTITQIQKWDKETQKVITVSASTEEAEDRSNPMDNSDRKMWLIDQLVSPAGTIKNEIRQEWVDSGEYRTWTEQYDKKVEVVYYETVHGKNKEGEKLYYVTKTNEETGKVTATKELTTKKTDFKHFVQEKKYKWESKSFTKTIEGSKWENIPKYVGEPDLSDITGSEYYRDYFENYEIYVPKEVMTKFDVAKRLDKTSEELDALLNEEEGGATTSATAVDVEGLNLGESVDAGAYKKALENLPFFEKYGEIYGIDPYIMIALTAQESGGSHYNADGTVRNNANIGLMQVGKVSGSSSRTVTTRNFDTGQDETFSASYDKLLDLETNIKWGTMYLANTIANNDYNILSGIQAYNFGSFEGEWSVESALAQQKKHANGSTRNADNPLGPYNYGDAYYVPHVLRHYASPDSAVPWVKNKEGEVLSMEGSSVSMGTVDSVNAATLGTNSGNTVWNSFYRKVRMGWDAISGGVKDVFGLNDEHLKTRYNDIAPDAVRQRIHNPQDYDEAWDTTKLMIAYEEGNQLSFYDSFTEEDFKERFGLMFTTPFGDSLFKKETKKGVDPTTYFADGFVEPVSNPKIVTKYGFIKDGDDEVYHQGIDLAVTDGQAIKAIADGEVFSVSKDGEKQIMIQHDLGVITTYKGLKGIKVKEGDKVKKGQTIATGGGSPHVKGTFHFELKQYGKTQDPTWIVKPEALSGSGAVVLDPNAKGVFQSPFPNTTFVYTSPRIMRVHPVTGVRKMHHGADIVASTGAGAPVHSVAAGKVVVAAWEQGWGNYVVVDHGVIGELNGIHVFTLSAHMQDGSVVVKTGDTIEKGQKIGKMGNTGVGTGAHLHIEFIVSNAWTDKDGAGQRMSVDPGLYLELGPLQG